MKNAPTQFENIDLTNAVNAQEAAVLHGSQLPYLSAFCASVMVRQANVLGQNIRGYCLDILSRGYFEVVSPVSGAVIRSGASFVLMDKCVLFSFPAEPDFFIGVGDLGRGFPLCSAVLTKSNIWLSLEATDWGFSQARFQDARQRIISLEWQPANVVGPPIIVTGDSNFAHLVWNQLSPLFDLERAGIVTQPFGMVVTNAPLGPIPEMFPKIKFGDVRRVSDQDIPALNGFGRVFLPLGGTHIQQGLVERLFEVWGPLTADPAAELDTSLAACEGPILWMSVRTRNRTLTNQEAVLAKVAIAFLEKFETGAILIDGHSFPDDRADISSHMAQETGAIIAADLRAGTAIRAEIAAALPDRAKAVFLGIGLSISQSIRLSRRASIYFCHHGTVQHKIGWFTAAPGMVHSNRAMTLSFPGRFVGAQCDIATEPVYVPVDLIADAAATSSTEFSALLHHENYTITNPDNVAGIFVAFAQKHLAGYLSWRERIWGSKNSKRQPSTKGIDNMLPIINENHDTSRKIDIAHFAAMRPTRHLVEKQEILEPSGVLYTDFFRFIDQTLQPKLYFEIGTQLGRSVREFSCDAICVDPDFIIERDLIAKRRRLSFFQMTSDDFFSDNAVNKVFGKLPDICFLDGMHRAEYLLRDFINTEKECHSRSVIFMHDCLPSNARMALRTHVEGHPDEGMWQYAWTGDVWKIVPLLKKYRPDLQVHMIDCAPTGLVAVSNLNPESTLLTDSYHNLVAEMRDLDLEAYTIAKLWQNYPVLSSRSLMEHPHDLTLFLNIF